MFPENEKIWKDYELCMSMFSADLIAHLDGRPCSEAVKKYYNYYISIACTPVPSFLSPSNSAVIKGVSVNG